MNDPVEINTFAKSLESLQKEVSSDMKDQGFWSWENVDLLVKTAKIMLIATELAELVEGLRVRDKVGSLESYHIPEFTNEEEELADVIIRVLDYAGHYDLDVAGALLQKVKYNKTREFRHGKTT